MSTKTKRRSRKHIDKRLRSARWLLQQWRRSVTDCHKCLADGPDCGRVVNEGALHELKRFDEAIAAVGEAIDIVTLVSKVRREQP